MNGIFEILFKKFFGKGLNNPWIKFYVEFKSGGYKRMNNIPKLIDAVCQAFMMGLPGEKWAPSSDGETHCNEAVNYVASAMGYDKFAGSLANTIFTQLQTSGEWQDVTADAAQFHANSGALVIAAWKNPIGRGHVCIVIPGMAEKSNSWNDIAPKVMNIGETNFIGKKASFAFSADRKPQFFALKSMI